MKFITRNLDNVAAAMLALVVGMTAVSAFGQNKAELKEKSRSFCSSDNNWSSDDRVSKQDLREFTKPATGELNVDAGKNGGITVRGEERSDILVRACVQAWAKNSEEANAIAAGVKINDTNTLRAESLTGETNWSVSYEIRVPRNTDLNLTANNGGVAVDQVDGTLNFGTKNGGIFLSGVSGDVKGQTTNGGVFVRLDGTSWNGNGLDVKTTNGGVNLVMSANYAANIETGTVNGGFKSEIPSLNITTENIRLESEDRVRSKRINTVINGGGAPIRIVTTNGGVKITTPE